MSSLTSRTRSAPERAQKDVLAVVSESEARRAEAGGRFVWGGGSFFFLHAQQLLEQFWSVEGELDRTAHDGILVGERGCFFAGSMGLAPLDEAGEGEEAE